MVMGKAVMVVVMVIGMVVMVMVVVRVILYFDKIMMSDDSEDRC